MGHADIKLPHFVFFEALAEVESEDTPEWRTISAGLLTLRFFDAWVLDGPYTVRSDSWGLRLLRKRIEEISAGDPIRALLGSILDAMSTKGQARPAVVAPRLMAYARALQFEARWSLAADVYGSVIRYADRMSDPDLVISAHMQLGACLRVLAKWDEAVLAYAFAGMVADGVGDVMNVLRARIAEANLATDRGNLPLAEEILDDTIDLAREPELIEVRSIALQDRGYVAHRRGDYEMAIKCAYKALGGMPNQTARDRVLADLAATFLEIGLHSAARDANLVLAATAQEQYTRWVAMINLLELAAIDRMEPVFEQYRRELADAPIPASLATYYHLYVGKGYQVFGKHDLAVSSLEQAMDIATRHRLNEMMIRVEQSLQEVRAGTTVAAVEATNPSKAVSEVAEAIRGMRTLAGVGGT